MAVLEEIEGLPFEEAEQFWREKVPMPHDQYMELVDKAKVLAFSVSGAGQMDVILDLYEEIDRAIEEGVSFRQFQKNAEDIFKRRGWAGPKPWHLDLIFRNNTAAAYGAGRYRQLEETKATRPYWRYSAVLDSRTRPSHFSLHGRIWPADDPMWNQIYPPNGHRCRCSTTSLSPRDLARMGVSVETQPPDMKPDPGFAFNPGKEMWQPDLNDYPKWLADQYREREAKQ